MVETLYKTSKPEESASEYYTLSIFARPGSLPATYVFTEKHGWWDDKLKRLIHSITTFRPEEELTLREAEEMYRALRINRARSGFVHSFTPDQFNNQKHEYQLIEREPES